MYICVYMYINRFQAAKVSGPPGQLLEACLFFSGYLAVMIIIGCEAESKCKVSTHVSLPI